MARRALRTAAFALAASLCATAASLRAQDPALAAIRELQAMDARVAAVSHRIQQRNAPRCPATQPVIGMTVHTLDAYAGAYRTAAVRGFALDRGPGVLAVVPGGPADRAGLAPGDVLVSIDGAAPDAAPRRGAPLASTRVLDQVDAALADGRVVLGIERGGAARTVTVVAERACPARVEVVSAGGLDARADGRRVQIDAGTVVFAGSDAALAAVLAHEISHNILCHRVRIARGGGNSGGLLSGLGRSGRLNRAAEIEADRFGIYLLEGAGYDVAAGLDYWRRLSRARPDLIRDGTHPGWRERLAAMAEVAAGIAAARARGSEPAPPIAPNCALDLQ